VRLLISFNKRTFPTRFIVRLCVYVAIFFLNICKIFDDTSKYASVLRCNVHIAYRNIIKYLSLADLTHTGNKSQAAVQV